MGPTQDHHCNPPLLLLQSDSVHTLYSPKEERHGLGKVPGGQRVGLLAGTAVSSSSACHSPKLLAGLRTHTCSKRPVVNSEVPTREPAGGCGSSLQSPGKAGWGLSRIAQTEELTAFKWLWQTTAGLTLLSKNVPGTKCSETPPVLYTPDTAQRESRRT